MATRLSAWIAAMLLSVALGADGEDPASRYQALVKKYDVEQRNYVSALYRAKTREQEQEAAGLRPNIPEFAGKYLELAREAPAATVGFASCHWIILNSPGSEEGDAAYRLLIDHHLDNKRLNEVQNLVADWPTKAGQELLRAAAERTTRPEIRGCARLTLGKVLAAEARRPGPSAKATRDEARALLTAVVDEHASLKADNGKSYGEIARTTRSKLDDPMRVGTEIGEKAPEIDGPNTKGDTMRLSASRGSVVMLAFWGHWCPWCHDFYPFGRSLKYRFNDRPFVLLGINGDGDPDTLRRTMANEGITWPNWWIGKNPQIGRDYPVERYPTTLLLDHNGVIRYRSFGTIDDQSLTRAANTLLDERERDPNTPEKAPDAPAPKKAAKKKR